MEPNGLPGGMFSSMSSGMVGLEISLQPQRQQHPHHQMVGYGHHPQNQQPMNQPYPCTTKAKPQQLTLSDEDEPGLTADHDSGGDGKRKASPWHRMKWTDNMIKLLIMIVYYIGDEAGSESNDPAAGRKKGGGVLQKKGKWKSVSRAMMEKGFYVSPQQCEDKFNDLNKRYKRVNDLLGKGTACRVVENQSLLESMDHLSQKMKEEVKKLLNSKHLFFREMCAYHHSCGGGGGGGDGGTSGGHHSPEVAGEPSQIQQQSQQQRCFHSENSSIGPDLGRAETEALKMAKGGCGEEEYGEDEDDDDDEDEDEEDEDEDEVVEEGRGRIHEHGHEEDNHDNDNERYARKRPRNSPLIQELSIELMSLGRDETKSSWEKRQWMKTRLMQLEEQRLRYKCVAFELEKQRLKWVRFYSKKEREMEREKIKTERMKIENERMLLLLRQKELELLDVQLQQQTSSSKRTDSSPLAG